MSTGKSSAFYIVLIAIASMAVGMVIASRLDLPPASSAQTVNVPATNSAPLNGPIDATTFRNIAKVRARRSSTSGPRRAARNRELTEFFGGRRRPAAALLRRAGTAAGAARPHPTAPPHRKGPDRLHHRQGRLHPHQQPRRRRGGRIRVSLFGAGRIESYAAKVVGHDTLTDTALLQLTEMPRSRCRKPVRRFGADAARRLGRGDRQPVSSRPHRQRRRDHGLGRPSAACLDATACSRPTRRSIPGIRRAAAQRARRGRRHEHGDLHRSSARRTSGSGSRRRSTRSAICCRNCATAR